MSHAVVPPAKVNRGNVMILLAAFVAAACGGGAEPAAPKVEPPVLTEVAVVLDSANVTLGATVQATATPRDQKGNVMTGVPIVWSIEGNPAVASITTSGTITTVSAGLTQVVATSAGVRGTATLTVREPERAVNAVGLSVAVDTIGIGTSTLAVAAVTDAQGQSIDGKAVLWAVDHPEILSVDTSGVLTGVSTGTATVSATVDGITGSAAVSVVDSVVDMFMLQEPERPREIIKLDYPSNTGKVWQVSDGQDLQAALNGAKRGDQIVLQAGATFTGNFTLPRKAGSVEQGWIILRSSQLELMPAGQRVTPQQASMMPKIVTPNQAAALATAVSASGWWIAGIEVTVDPAFARPKQQYGIVLLGDGSNKQNSLDQVPQNLVLDRVYIHGQDNTQTSRCVGLNSGRTVIQDSYLSECHSKGVDAQAIGGWNGPGPYRIFNNTLIGSGENILFGGADPAIPDLTPSDIEIRRNYIYTPPSWKGAWTRKNLIETKNAQRLLIEGNLLEGSWGDGQVGIGVIFKSANQSGRCTWCATRDVTFRYNVLQKIGQPINLAGKEGSNQHPVGELLNRVLIEQNIVDSVNIAPYTGDARFILLSAGAQNVIIRRNTIVTTGAQQTFMTFAKGQAVTNLVVESNIFTKGKFGLHGVGPTSGFGAKALVNAGGQVRFANNVIVGQRPKEPYPPTTMWASSIGQALGMGGRGATASVVWGTLNAVKVP